MAREAALLDLTDDDRDQVPTLIRRAEPVANTWDYQNKVMQWDIRQGDRVLDVGSGGWPFRLATHLVDRYPGSTSHRVEPLITGDRPLIVADVWQLPFADRSFDFVFCSHVLEHVSDPGRAIREIARVGKRGYIETPSRLSDVMFNFTGIKDHHRWHTLRLGDTLVMIEWQDDERRDTGVGAFFRLLQSSYENPFQTLFERNRDLFYTQLHWSGFIKFLIIDKNGYVIDTCDRVDEAIWS